MTLQARNKNNVANRLPSKDERDAAKQLYQALTAHATPDGKSYLKVTGPTGDSTQTKVELTPALSQLLTDLLGHVAMGDAVNLTPVNQVLTTDQAADILNVPPRYFLGLLKSDDIHHELIGRHQRVKAEDLFRYKAVRDARRTSALNKLASLDSDSI